MSSRTEPDYYDDGSGHKGQTFECDAPGCRESYDGLGEFTDVWADARDAGWRAVKCGRKWKHLCPEHCTSDLE